LIDPRRETPPNENDVAHKSLYIVIAGLRNFAIDTHTGRSMGRTHSADRRWAAYHEAGHAVVTIVRAGLVPEIGVTEEGGGYSRPPREHALVRCSIEISLAGLLAEARARKKAEIDVLLDAGQPDFKKAMRDASIAAAEEGRNHLSILADATRIARRVIRDYWPVVARLANAVFEYGDMSREEVAHVAAIHQARAGRYSRSLDDHTRRLRASRFGSSGHVLPTATAQPLALDYARLPAHEIRWLSK
jgi:hypothetical protein